jgi:rhodanese-related sulfurtransferase
MSDITVQELKSRLDAGTAPKIIDVREPYEYEAGHIHAENIPMGTVPARIAELGGYRDQELVICCRSGGRSGQITNYLRAQGFANVRNLTGGMLAWQAQIDPSFRVG